MPESARPPINTTTPVDEERTYITGPDGQPRLVGIVREHTEIDEQGMRRYIKTKIHITAADGLVINTEKPQTFDCSICGRQFITEQSIRWCHNCHAVICIQACAHPIQLDETQEVHLCPACHQRANRANLLHYLFSTDL